MIQDPRSLEAWHEAADPWGYETHPDDRLRKSRLLAELPGRDYRRTLDIGCGQGFITRDLPGREVVGVDVSAEAIRQAQAHASARLRFVQASLFDLPARLEGRFDLVVITGVLYPQYVGHALTCAYRIVDRLLEPGGLLVSVHIDAWYQARFPLLKLRDHFYAYREYTHRLEVYVK